MEDERAGSGRPQSSTRVYIGNLPPNVQKADVESHFNTHGTGKILETKLMNGFGFLEYEDALDARDVVPTLHGTDFMGQRLTVQFARGPRERDTRGPPPGGYYAERSAPRTRRTVYRMTMAGLPAETSWQDLKDFARMDGLDVVYSEIPRDRDGTGFVEYETETDLNNAVAKMDGREFRGTPIQCNASVQPERPRDHRHRSRSPPRRFDGPPRYQDDYDRRGPPPRYRDRSPPPPRRGYYEDRGYGRSPPPARSARGPPPPVDDYRGGRAPPPVDDYPPRGGAYRQDEYPPRSYGGGYRDEPYANGGPRGGGYDRPPSPPRRQTPRGSGGYGAPGYDDRRGAY